VRVDLEQRLDDWTAVGLLSSEQAAAIRAYERGRDEGPSQDGGGRRVSLVAEAVGYLGAALVLTAAILLLDEVWPTLTEGGRISLAAIATAVVAGVAWLLRDADEPALRRLRALLLGGTVVGAAMTAGLVGDRLDVDDDLRATAVGLVASVVALPLYLRNRTWLQQAALLAGLVVAGMGLLELGTPAAEAALAGIVFVSLGVAWSALSWVDLLPPARSGDLLGGLVALAGCQAIAFEHTLVGVVAGLVVSAALLWRSVAVSSTPLLVVGSGAVVVLLPQLVFELFADTLGAPLTLLVIGLLLVLVAAAIVRVKAEVEEADAAGSHGDPAAPADREPTEVP
jgi:hypothetical protein